ncbi:hypothetical protein AB9T89_06625 [Flavobacterium oncorhynchi]|uniref:hypothetical protein n=1 Tax=Flavobacterium oncorhynchi TaxID=728056 RepID=UPI003519F15A
MYSSAHACMQDFIPSCGPANSQAVKPSSMHIAKQVLRQSSITNKGEDIFPKETEKGKKEKESNFTGRDSDRPKGIGISPEGCLVRYEQVIMPKSFCQTETRHTFVFSFYFFLRKKHQAESH